MPYHILSSEEIEIIHICKNKTPTLKALRAAVSNLFFCEAEDATYRDIASALFTIYGQVSDVERLFLVTTALLDENPDNYSLDRDKKDQWQNLIAILVSRIRLTPVEKLLNMGYKPKK